jgi:hypothetical protein
MLRVFNFLILLFTVVVMYYTISLMAGFIVKVQIPKHLPPLALRTAITFIFLFLAYAITYYDFFTIYSKYVLIFVIGSYIILLRSKMSEISQVASIFTAGLCLSYIFFRFIGIIRRWDRTYFNMTYHSINLIIVLLLIWLFSSSIYKNRLTFSPVDKNLTLFPKYKHSKKIFGEGVWYVYLIVSLMVLFFTILFCITAFSLFTFLSLNAHVFLQRFINSIK